MTAHPNAMLVIDDDRSLFIALNALFRQKFDVLHAPTGQAALQLL
jgi:DNA-binding response OmpR family regulator